MFGDDVDTAGEQDVETGDDEMTEKMQRARHDGEEEPIDESKDELLNVFEEVKEDE